MAKINPPKSHRYPITMQKSKNAIDTQKILQYMILSVIIVAILCAQILVVVSVFYLNTPYGLIRTSKYIKVGDYKNIEVKRSDIVKVFDETILSLRKASAVYPEVTEGKVLESYNVKVNIVGYLVDEDGNVAPEPFANGTLVDYEITDIGNHYTTSGKLFMKEIQTAIIGSDINGGDIPVSITYPEDHEMVDLRGKDAVLYVTIRGVTQTVLPEYNDDFIARVTKFSTVSEYEADLIVQTEFSYIWTMYIEMCEIKGYPQSKIDFVKNDFVDYYKAYAEYQEMSFEDLLKNQLILTEEQFMQEAQKYAEGTVKEELALYWLVKTEWLRYSRKDYKTYSEKLVIDYEVADVDELEELYGKEIIVRTIYWEKAKEFLFARTTILENQ